MIDLLEREKVEAPVTTNNDGDHERFYCGRCDSWRSCDCCDSYF